jgi:DNA ligase 1
LSRRTKLALLLYVKFSELANVYDEIGKAGSDSARVRLLSDTFKKAKGETLRAVAHFSFGELVPPEHSGELGIGPGAIRNEIAALAGKSSSEIDDEVRETGDMSEVAARYADGHDKLKVDELWRSITEAIEKGESRELLIKRVFENTTARGVKYFTRMALNQMRLNVGLGTMTRSLAKAFDVTTAAIEHFYAMTNDIGLAALQASKGEAALEHGGLKLFQPYQFMNAQKIEDADRIIPSGSSSAKNWILETKYDGVRLQIHIQKRPSKITLFSRRLNDDTGSMPDVVDAVKKAWKGGDAIVEGEVIAFDPGLKRRLPFQAVLQRLGRKHSIAKMVDEIPLVLYLFDVLYDDGESLMATPQKQRRERLEKLFKPTAKVQLTEGIVTNKRSTLDKFFASAVTAGQEGVMVKDPDGIYIPGRRTEMWMKLKPAFETIDAAIVGGIWGSGRRKGLLSSLIIAIRGSKDELLTVGKVGTGYSEATLRDLTDRLKPKIITTHGYTVEIAPEMVIEVDFQDIQKTDRYEAGYVLRIPRFKRERPDKSVREADNLARLKRMYAETHS